MKSISILLAGASLFAGCFGLDFGNVGDKVPGSVYAAPLDCLNYRADGTYLSGFDKSEARGGNAFDEIRTRVQEVFDGTLEPDLELPLAILEVVNGIDLEVIDNDTIAASFPVPFRGDELDVDVTIRKENGRLQDEFVVNKVKRVTISHDLFGTVADAVIFNADKEPVFTAAFTRDDEAIRLLLENANNKNTFLTLADRNTFFLGREEDHDGQVSENLEFQIRANTDEVALQINVQIPILGELQICVGEQADGQFGRLDCDEIQDLIAGVGEGIGPF
jgi:hypothetical protein